VNAADYGVPQKRKRLIVVATREDISAPAFPPPPLPLRVSVAEVIQMPVDRAAGCAEEARREITGGQLLDRVEARERLGAAYNQKFDSSYRVMDTSKPSRTLSSGYPYPGNGANTLKHECPDGTARYFSLSTRDAMRIQGFPDDYAMPALPISKLRAILANAVPPGLACAVARCLHDCRHDR
jgi:site-specific DNA-cytosine methylase